MVTNTIRRSPTAKASAKSVKAETANADMTLAATAIFGGGKNEFPLKSGKLVSIRPARMNQLSLVVDLFSKIVLSIDPESLGALIELIADKQRTALAAKQDPNGIAIDELSTAKLVRQSFGNVSLIRQLFMAVFNDLPKFAEAFTNVTAEEFGELEVDEGMLIAGGIFMLNYSFFTQNLPPILSGFMRSLASKQKPPQPAQGSTGPNRPRK